MSIKFGLLPAVPLFVLFTLAVPIGRVNRSSIATTANRFRLDWFKLCPSDEEFSVLVPTKPTVTVEPLYTYAKGRESVLGHIAYSGYVEDFAFVIESYQHDRVIPDREDVRNRTASGDGAALGLPHSRRRRDTFARLASRRSG